MSFELPPALAGGNSEVTPDSQGVSNFARFVGGMALTFLGVGVAVAIKDRVMDAAPADTGDFSIQVN